MSVSFKELSSDNMQARLEKGIHHIQLHVRPNLREPYPLETLISQKEAAKLRREAFASRKNQQVYDRLNSFIVGTLLPVAMTKNIPLILEMLKNFYEGAFQAHRQICPSEQEYYLLLCKQLADLQWHVRTQAEQQENLAGMVKWSQTETWDWQSILEIVTNTYRIVEYIYLSSPPESL